MSAYDHKGDWPAFPVPLNPGESYSGHAPCDGMTLRQYAAIKLRVPNSGTDWLDDMIRQSVRNDLESKIVQGIYASGLAFPEQREHFENIAEDAHVQADVILNRGIV